MVMPIRHRRLSRLTGRVRARRGWFGKMILQVEWYYDSVCGLKWTMDVGKVWRDAREEDLNMKFAPLNILNFVKTDQPCSCQHSAST